MQWIGHNSLHLIEEDCKRSMLGNPEGKTSLGRTRYKWEDIIKVDLLHI
jgi:hypothetical protein